MNPKKYPLIVAAALSFFSLAAAAFAQGTAFTYQGRLNNGANPANGAFDLTFALYGADTGGVPIAGPVTNSSVNLTNGLFTTTVDFGAAFTGASNWLQIAVSPSGADSFSPLLPRQQLTPAPYAIFAGAANDASTAITANSATTATTATTAISFSGSLAGDVTGTQSATVVSTVGGQTAANIASGASAAKAAASANTASAIVKRDSSGNFSAGTITANLSGNATTATTASNVTGNITDTQLSANIARLNGTNIFSGVVRATNVNNIITGAFTGNLTGNASTATTATSATSATSATTATTATTANNFSGSLAGDVTGAQSATVVAKVGGLTAANVASGANAANAAASANAASAIVKRDASGNFSAGTVTASFNGDGASLTNLNAYSLTGPVTFQQNGTSPNVILGYSSNSISSGVVGSVISGGGEPGTGNSVAANFSMIGSGVGNAITSANSRYSFIGSGERNQIHLSDHASIASGEANQVSLADHSFIGSGSGNSAGGDHSFVGSGTGNSIKSSSCGIAGGEDNSVALGANDGFIGGGLGNSITSPSFDTAFAVLVGGESNLVTGRWAAVPGGFNNMAGGQYSFAAGQQAQALNDGSFVWADSQNSSFASTANDQFLIRAQGGVGIGTTSPSSALQVNGTVTATSFLGTSGDNTFAGKVGIGTASPGAALQVVGSGFFGDDSGSLPGSIGTGIRIFRDTSTGSGAIFAYNYGAGSPTNLILQQAGGKVGIGTTTPAAGLDVEVSGAVSDGAWGYYDESGFEGGPFSGSPNLAIYTSGGIGAQTYYAFSDARIKNVIGVSDAAKDLNALMAIHVTDFTYKDKAKYGAHAVKKVIAQQVESVYPQAVAKTTGVIPDICQQAEIKDGWIQLATDLKKDDRVKLISGQTQGVYDVLEASATQIRTAFNPGADKVFVYGREVNDFRNVDYEALTTLNVSATQELARRLAEQTAENSDLKTRLAKLEARDAQLSSLEKEVAQMRQRLAQLTPAAPSVLRDLAATR